MNAWKSWMITVVLIFFLCGAASAAVRISPLPPPPPTAKLRVFVVAVTMEFKSAKGPAFWPVSPEEFDRKQKQAIDERLKQQGIYEVVGDRDIRAVLGTQKIASWEWVADDNALAKSAGRALHADYVLVSRRSFTFHLQFDTALINLNTGQTYEASGYVPSTMVRFLTDDQKKQAGAEAVNIQFRRIFHDARGDLLKTAMLKGRVEAKEPTSRGQPPRSAVKPEAPPVEKKEVVPVPPKEKKSQALPVQPQKAQTRDETSKTAGNGAISEKQRAFEKELEQALASGDRKTDRPRLVVYDFEAAERMKIVGLILTEALREELHRAGGFVLVNRENVLKIMDEYKLQQTSLVDEKQALKLGKWLAANEAVTGNLAVLGNTSVLQAKRIDIKTLGTLALGSLKCPAGREDELLDRMPELAGKLISGKQ